MGAAVSSIAGSVAGDLQKSSDTRYPKKEDVYSKSQVFSKSETYPRSDLYTRSETDLTFPKKTDVYMRSETDQTFPKLTDVYTRAESDTRYATAAQATANATALTDVYTKKQADDTFPFRTEIYTRDESDKRFASSTDSLKRSEADGLYAPLGTVAANQTAISNVYSKSETMDLFAQKKDVRTASESDATYAFKDKVYTKDDLDSFMAAFRNSLGLPATDPFPAVTRVNPTGFAVYPGVDPRFFDMKVTKQTSAAACREACRNPATDPGIGFTEVSQYNAGAQDCWCKYSTGDPVLHPDWEASINVNKSRTSSWRDVGSLGTTFNSPMAPPATPRCLVPVVAGVKDAAGNTTFVSTGRCTGEGNQLLTWNHTDQTLRNKTDGKCLSLTADGKGVEFRTCETGTAGPGATQRWNWSEAGRLENVSTASDPAAIKCLQVDPAATGTDMPPVTVANCSVTPGNNQRFYPAFEWATNENMRLRDNGNADFNITGVTNPVPNVSLPECRQRCAENANCEFFLYEGASTRNCHLKQVPRRSATDTTPASIHIVKYPGGMRYYRGPITKGVDIGGYDLDATVRNETLAQCGKSCEDNVNCHFAGWTGPASGGTGPTDVGQCKHRRGVSNSGSYLSWKPMGHSNPAKAFL